MTKLNLSEIEHKMILHIKDHKQQLLYHNYYHKITLNTNSSQKEIKSSNAKCKLGLKI